MDIIHVGQIAGALGAILGVGGLIVKWAIVKPIKMYIDQATYPIQPNANGGKSLPDLVAQVEHIKELLLEHIQTRH